jgi:twitching motility protein PilT
LYDGVVYRVTHLDSNEPGGTYVLRKSKAELRDFRSLGIPHHFIEAVLAAKAAGILLICGGFGVGKTSTAASFVVAYLKAHGGVALAIEDPNETAIDGVHGRGRCIAISASRHKGGYKEHLLRGLRSGADLIFLGEIRDSETAYEAVKAGSNGELIVATMHAGSAMQALERLITLASTHTTTAEKILADSLLGIVWQDLSSETSQGGREFKRLTVSTLLVVGDMASGIREKIRHGQIPSLTQEIEQQATRSIWGK